MYIYIYIYIYRWLDRCSPVSSLETVNDHSMMLVCGI